MCHTQPQQLNIAHFQEIFPYSALLFPPLPPPKKTHEINFTHKERNLLRVSGIKLWEPKVKRLKGISKNKKGIIVTETPTYTLQQLLAITIWKITAKQHKQICSGTEEQIALNMSAWSSKAHAIGPRSHTTHKAHCSSTIDPMGQEWRGECGNFQKFSARGAIRGTFKWYL